MAQLTLGSVKMIKWNYSKGETKYGPVDEVEVVRLIQIGELPQSTPVCKEGETNWAPASKYTCFQVEIINKGSTHPNFSIESAESSYFKEGAYTYEPQDPDTFSYRKPLFAGLAAIIVGVCAYLWWNAESRQDTLLAIHLNLIESERNYISELNKSPTEFGFQSFILESENFLDKLERLSSEPDINLEKLPKEYLRYIDSLGEALYSVGESARRQNLDDLESLDEEIVSIRSYLDAIAKNSGLDSSSIPTVPELSLIQRIKDFERAKEARIQLEKDQELSIAEAEMRRRRFKEEMARQAEIEAANNRKAEQKREAASARINLILQAKKDILDAETNYVFYWNNNTPLANNVYLYNDRILAQARFKNIIENFQSALEKGLRSGAFDDATQERIQRLIKNLDQELALIQKWDIKAVNDNKATRDGLIKDLHRNW